MGLSLKGDRTRLKAWAKRFGNPDKMLELAAKDGCEETLNLISEGFSAGKDPYGASWDAPNNLQITGRLRSFTKAGIGPGGWKVVATDKKAIWHHAPQPRAKWGGQALPTRLLVPTKGKGLPGKWAKRLRKALVDVMKEYVAGG